MCFEFSPPRVNYGVYAQNICRQIHLLTAKMNLIILDRMLRITISIMYSLNMLDEIANFFHVLLGRPEKSV
jgi:hypothetical protein